MSEEKKKGFFEVLKSKPQTLDEAKKKTKYFFILVGAIGLVFSVLAALLHIFFGIIMLVGCAGIFGFLYMKENQKNKRNFCPDCGARIDYENGVEWEVTKYDEKDYTPNANAKGKQVISKRIATVEFTCTCTECGAVKTFTQNYDAIVWYDDGTHKKNNIEAMAKNYFKI
ncbi:MAG: hypothetical protein IJW29_02400 [Clostridia bacterium]|nr:hypothetical protein [Clostridia bacterium]